MKGQLRHIITVVGCLLTGAAFCQCCFDPVRLTRDTSFIQQASQIYLLETPNNKKYRVTVKYEEVVPVVIVNTYDNTDPLINYSGTWFNGQTTATGFSNNTMAYSNVAGNSFTIQFTGFRFEFMAEYKSTSSRAGVTIDNKPEEVVNLNSGTGIQTKGWDLAQGFHTVKIRVMDAKYLVFDGYKTYNQ